MTMRLRTSISLGVFIPLSLASCAQIDNAAWIRKHPVPWIELDAFAVDLKEHRSIPARAIASDGTTENLRVRAWIRGSLTRDQPSISLRSVDTQDVYTDLSLFGLPVDHRWSLEPVSGIDQLLSMVCSRDLFTQFGRYAPRIVPCEISLSGEHIGTYLLCETVDRADTRIDIKKLDPEEITEPMIHGGYILKVDKPDQETIGKNWFLSSNNLILSYQYPGAPNTAQRNYMESCFQSFCGSLEPSRIAHPSDGWRGTMDGASWVDWVLFAELTETTPGIDWDIYYIKDRWNAIEAGPPRPCGTAFGENAGVWPFEEERFRSSDAFPASALFLEREFVSRMLLRWRELRNGTLSVSTITELLERSRIGLSQTSIGSMTGEEHIQDHLLRLQTRLVTRMTWMDRALQDHVNALYLEAPENSFP